MNIEGQEMEIYQIFVFPMGDNKITEEIQFHPRKPMLKHQAKEGLDYESPPKNSVSPSHNIEKAKEYLVAPKSENTKQLNSLSIHKR